MIVVMVFSAAVMTGGADKLPFTDISSIEVVIEDQSASAKDSWDKGQIVALRKYLLSPLSKENIRIYIAINPMSLSKARRLYFSPGTNGTAEKIRSLLEAKGVKILK